MIALKFVLMLLSKNAASLLLLFCPTVVLLDLCLLWLKAANHLFWLFNRHATGRVNCGRTFHRSHAHSSEAHAARQNPFAPGSRSAEPFENFVLGLLLCKVIAVVNITFRKEISVIDRKKLGAICFITACGRHHQVIFCLKNLIHQPICEVCFKARILLWLEI